MDVFPSCTKPTFLTFSLLVLTNMYSMSLMSYNSVYFFTYFVFVSEYYKIGFMYLQLPLDTVNTIDTDVVLNAITPAKDVDG